MNGSQMLTVAELAEEFRVNVSKIIAWIRSGELRAIDVSEKRGKRGRWRIERAALESFKSSRENSSGVATTTRRRRRVETPDEF